MRFRDMVDIQQDQSADGSPQEDFSGTPFLARVPCEIKTISGDETFRGRQLTANTNHVVTMPHYPGIRTRMRLLCRGRLDGRILNITDVRELDLDERGRRRLVELYCSEASPQ